MKSFNTQPSVPETDAISWRYMDGWKFEKMLRTFSEQQLWTENGVKNVECPNSPGQLWFSYPWTLSQGDNGEGAFPVANTDPDSFCDRMAAMKGLPEAEAIINRERFLAVDTKPLREAIFYMAQLSGVSCWHHNVSETERMWDFIEEKNGVALKSTVGAVEKALVSVRKSPAKFAEPSFCSVGYFDHSKDFLMRDGFRSLLAVVDRGCYLEQEIRFVAKSHHFHSLPLKVDLATIIKRIMNGQQLTFSAEERVAQCIAVAAKAKELYEEKIVNQSEGFYLPIALDSMLSEVVVSPESDSGYFEKVRSLMQSVGLSNVAVKKSCGDQQNGAHHSE